MILGFIYAVYIFTHSPVVGLVSKPVSLVLCPVVGLAVAGLAVAGLVPCPVAGLVSCSIISLELCPVAGLIPCPDSGLVPCLIIIRELCPVIGRLPCWAAKCISTCSWLDECEELVQDLEGAIWRRMGVRIRVDTGSE